MMKTSAAAMACVNVEYLLRNAVIGLGFIHLLVDCEHLVGARRIGRPCLRHFPDKLLAVIGFECGLVVWIARRELSQRVHAIFEARGIARILHKLSLYGDPRTA